MNIEEFHKKYHNTLLNISQRIVGKIDDAEDMVQETYLKLLEKGDPDNIHPGWMIKVVTTESLLFLRNSKDTITFEEVNFQVNSVFGQDPMTLYETGELFDNIAALCKQFGIKSRQTFYNNIK